MNFTSDNAWGIWPEMLAALEKASSGSEPSYGGDAITDRLESRFAEVFEHPVRILPVITGTAANALALSALTPGHGAVFCQEGSHIVVDECAAVEFFSHGARLVPLRGDHGKLSPSDIRHALARFQRGFVHHSQPAAISIAQATELGTVYTPDEIGALSALALKNDLKLHMDGARLANALAHLNCSPAEATWRAGVDVLSFGATKGGALAAEAIVFFHHADAHDVEYRRKRSGHLLSKMRFVSAQLETYLEDERWLKRARHANALAARLASGLRRVAGAELLHDVEANSVFVRLPNATIGRLRKAGAHFYEWGPSAEDRTLVRLVTSFATPEEDVDQFVTVASNQ